MKKIIGIIIIIGIVITGSTINSNAKDKTMTDVKIIDDYSFEIKYSDDSEVVLQFDTQLECAEQYTDIYNQINK